MWCEFPQELWNVVGGGLSLVDLSGLRCTATWTRGLKANWRTLHLGTAADELVLKFCHLPSVQVLVSNSPATVVTALGCTRSNVVDLTVHGGATVVSLDTLQTFADSMPSLSSLRLSGCQLPWPLAELTKFAELKSLDILYTPSDDVESLGTLALESLAVTSTQSRDLRSFQRLDSLRWSSFAGGPWDLKLPTGLKKLDLSCLIHAPNITFGGECQLRDVRLRAVGTCAHLVHLGSHLLRSATKLERLWLPVINWLSTPRTRDDIRLLLSDLIQHQTLQTLHVPSEEYLTIMAEFPIVLCQVVISILHRDHVESLSPSWADKVTVSEPERVYPRMFAP